MKDNSSLNQFPKKQIKPYDGMSITANVWTLAHEEHRQNGRAHNLVLHGSGIITGLEVVANDPADNYVFISPGVAVDTVGNVIELSEPVAYDFGDTAEGTLFLLLGHGEREIGGTQKDIRFLQNEFVIAARSNIPKRPSVELARVTLSDNGKAIKNASEPLHPGMDELDLRFRKSIGTDPRQPVRVALCKLGAKVSEITRGWGYLSGVCEHATSYQLIVDPGVAVSKEILAYELVYLGGAGSFNVTKVAVSAIKKYLDQGKKLIIEALDEPAQTSCQELISKLDRQLIPIPDGNSILTKPFLFGFPPEGANGNQVLLDSQVIYAAAGYGLAWAGKAAGGQMARAEIRSVHEWGINMIVYCLSNPEV